MSSFSVQTDFAIVFLRCVWICCFCSLLNHLSSAAKSVVSNTAGAGLVWFVF